MLKKGSFTFKRIFLFALNALLSKFMRISQIPDGVGPNAVQVKLLDLEFSSYESFANDLIFFLLLNGRIDELRTKFKSFIAHYHSAFTKTLTFVGCPLDDYTYDK